MQDKKSIIGIFIFFASFLFIAIFFLLPFNTIPFIFLGAGLIYTYVLYKDYKVTGDSKKRLYAILTLIASVLSYTLVNIGFYGPKMQLLMEADPYFTAWKALEISGMAGAAILYTRWFGILILYAVIYLLGVVISVILKNSTFYDVTSYFGYLFIGIMIGYNVIEILTTLSPTDPAFLINFIVPMPFVLYYTIEFAVWFLSGWTFVSNIFGTFIERVSEKGEI